MRYYTSRFISNLPAPLFAIVMLVLCIATVVVAIKYGIKMKRGEYPKRGWIFIIPVSVVACILAVAMRLYEFFCPGISIPKGLSVSFFASLFILLAIIIIGTIVELKRGDIPQENKKMAVASIGLIIISFVVVALMILFLK